MIDPEPVPPQHLLDALQDRARRPPRPRDLAQDVAAIEALLDWLGDDPDRWEATLDDMEDRFDVLDDDVWQWLEDIPGRLIDADQVGRARAMAHALAPMLGPEVILPQLIDDLLLAGQVTRARDELEEALERYPEEFALLRACAHRARELGDADLTIRLLRRAVDLATDRDDIQRGLLMLRDVLREQPDRAADLESTEALLARVEAFADQDPYGSWSDPDDSDDGFLDLDLDFDDLIADPAEDSGTAAADPPAPRRVVKVGRNDPCPCGSGRKYKKCCGAR